MLRYYRWRLRDWWYRCRQRMTTDDRVMLLVWAVMLIALGAAGWAFQPTAPAMHMVDQPPLCPFRCPRDRRSGQRVELLPGQSGTRRMLDLVTLALIDGDIVAYRAADRPPEGHLLGGESGVASSLYRRLAGRCGCRCRDRPRWGWPLARCSSAIVAFTGRENFRKRILPTSYKANRAGKVKPQAYAYVVRRMHEEFDTRCIEGLEADDVLGILATTETYSDAIILTVDKDLRTIPARHFNPLKDTKPVLRSEYAADAQWLMQTLTGDTSDGYTGIPGVGPKRAEKILGGDIRQLAFSRATPGDLWRRVVAGYRSAKLTEDDALVQARVARILRRSDYDKATKEVLLWHPTTPERIPLLPTQPAGPASSAATAGEAPISSSAPPAGGTITRKEAE